MSSGPVNPVSAIQSAPPATFTVASFTDANPNATAEDFTGVVTATSLTGQIVTSDQVTITQQGNGVFAVTATLGFPQWAPGRSPPPSPTSAAARRWSARRHPIRAPLVANFGLEGSAHTGIAIVNRTVGGFTDTNPQAQSSNFTAVIDWGDGSQTAGAIFQQDGGEGGAFFVVNGSHAYATPGNHRTQVSVVDIGGSSVTDVGGSRAILRGTTIVTDLPVTGAVGNFTAIDGINTGTVTLATFSDPNPLATASSLKATLVAGGGDGHPKAPSR